METGERGPSNHLTQPDGTDQFFSHKDQSYIATFQQESHRIRSEIYVVISSPVATVLFVSRDGALYQVVFLAPLAEIVRR